jgi:hypothetical protein
VRAISTPRYGIYLTFRSPSNCDEGIYTRKFSRHFFEKKISAKISVWTNPFKLVVLTEVKKGAIDRTINDRMFLRSLLTLYCIAL